MKDKKKFAFNILFFIVIISITYYIIFRNIDILVFMENLKRINIIYVILGIIVMFGFYFVEAVNIGYILNTFKEKVPLHKMIKFSLIGAFFSAITPASTGGQPMQIYYMNKEDINVSHTTLAFLIQMCGYQLFIVIFGLFFGLLNPELLGNGVIYFYLIGILFNIAALSFSLVGIFSKKITNKLVKVFIKILTIFKSKKIKQINEKIDQELDTFNESAKFIKKHKKEFVNSLLLSGLQVMCNYSIIYFTYKAFGLSAETFFSLFAIQSILRCAITSLPLPGAVGVSESAFIILFSKAFDSSILPNALLLHRFMNFYLYVFISLLVVLYNKVYLSYKYKKTKKA